MYYNGQIVYDLDAKTPVRVGHPEDGDWAWTFCPKRSTHFIECSGWENGKQTVTVYCPQSIIEAKDLLDKGLIQPSPISKDHCFNCCNWWSNHKSDGSCYEKTK